MSGRSPDVDQFCLFVSDSDDDRLCSGDVTTKRCVAGETVADGETVFHVLLLLRPVKDRYNLLRFDGNKHTGNYNWRMTQMFFVYLTGLSFVE